MLKRRLHLSRAETQGALQGRPHLRWFYDIFLWDLFLLSVGLSVALWGSVALSGALWRSLGLCGALWGSVALSGVLWRSLKLRGAPGGSLKLFGGPWGSLGPSGATWRSLSGGSLGALCSAARFWRP